MKFFVKDVGVSLMHTHLVDPERANVLRQRPRPELLRGHVVVPEPRPAHLTELIRLLRQHELPGLASVTLTGRNLSNLRRHIKSSFRVIRAAGGLVIKDDKYLMIYRLGRWDLPKGKLEGRESPKRGAVREVTEECNVRVKLDTKICTTWHAYERRGQHLLKKTKWYLMECTDDRAMRPQTDEGIERASWLSREEVARVLPDSYLSIAEVFAQFRQKFAADIP